jgi:hypothetical protein
MPTFDGRRLDRRRRADRAPWIIEAVLIRRTILAGTPSSSSFAASHP